MELEEIVGRLRMKQSIKAIKRETGKHRSVIRQSAGACRTGGLAGDPPAGGPCGSRPPSYRSVKDILVNELERLPQESPAEPSSGQMQFRFARQFGYFDIPVPTTDTSTATAQEPRHG